MDHIQQFSDQAAYPPVKVCAPNAMYASAMLTNMGSCNSEMSAVAQYVYNSLITQENFSEISKCFHQISLVEMHHLEIFGQLCLMLGADPRLWSRCHRRMNYWNAGCIPYTKDLPGLLKNAIAGENAAIEQYYQQTRWIKDPYIVEMLKRIICDEERHIVIFCQLYEQTCKK